MANTKLAFMATLAILLLLQASTPCAAARHHAGGTPGVMTMGFKNGEGDLPTDCDGRWYDSNRDLIAALSTRWYDGGRRCWRMIRITSKQNGRTVEARVVDECDSRYGCKDDVVDTSLAVWTALGLDPNVGEVPITWSDA